ncbi:MAG: acyltransferase family protein [Rhodocyclaceae bacterium]|nr:acyltransferase family protein [Rhodocyclaceae bacterium]
MSIWRAPVVLGPEDRALPAGCGGACGAARQPPQPGHLTCIWAAWRAISSALGQAAGGRGAAVKGTGVPDPDRLLARNNFDLLRLLFAGTVCMVHAYGLSGFRELAWIASFLSTAVAVKAFFVVSGFLIFMSYERSTSLASYTGKRIRRIYPAYFAVVMLCALGLALASAAPACGVLFVRLAQIRSGQPRIPELPAADSFPASSRRTTYLRLTGVVDPQDRGHVLRFGARVRVFVPPGARLPAIVFAYGASVAYWVLLTAAAERTGSGLYSELTWQLPGQLLLHVRRLALLPAVLRAAQGVLPGGSDCGAGGRPVRPAAGTGALRAGGRRGVLRAVSYLGNFGKHGDFSYSAYILHFPIIQLFVQAGWFGDSPALFLAGVVVAVGAGAVLIVAWRRETLPLSQQPLHRCKRCKKSVPARRRTRICPAAGRFEMPALVTGGNGFVGGRLVAALGREGMSGRWFGAPARCRALQWVTCSIRFRCGQPARTSSASSIAPATRMPSRLPIPMPTGASTSRARATCRMRRARRGCAASCFCPASRRWRNLGTAA